MESTTGRKPISLNVSVALALIAFLIWMVTSGLDVTTVYGATKPIPFTYDMGVFSITDLSIKEGTYSTDLIGFIQNVDPNLNTIKGTSLKIEMYDRNNHLIDVAESGYSSLPGEFAPQTKYAFKIPIDKTNDLDHLHIQILAQDWGTSNTYNNTYNNTNMNSAPNQCDTFAPAKTTKIVKTPDYSVKVPNTWTYFNGSNLDNLWLTRDEFRNLFCLSKSYEEFKEKLQREGGLAVALEHYTDIPLKNESLQSYVKYAINKIGILKIISQHYTTIGKEKAIRIETNESASFGNNTKGALYFIMHDKQPYAITYLSDPKNYEKYLPEFEQIVKSFRFAGIPSNETLNLSENENVTNTPTNFTGATLNRPYIGIAGLSLTPDLSNQIGLNQTEGILITNITNGSPADKSGLRAGTNTITYNGTEVNVGGNVILKIDNQSVSKIQEVISYLSQKHAGDKIHLTILRDNAIKELDVILGQPPSEPTSQTGGNQTQEELYNECVNVAGKSLCDFLYKR